MGAKNGSGAFKYKDLSSEPLDSHSNQEKEKARCRGICNPRGGEGRGTKFTKPTLPYLAVDELQVSK